MKSNPFSKFIGGGNNPTTNFNKNYKGNTRHYNGGIPSNG